MDRLKARLAEPTGFPSYKAIWQWLRTECKVEVEYNTVHRIVRYELNAKLKVPRPRHHKASTGGGGAVLKKTAPGPRSLARGGWSRHPTALLFCQDESRWGLLTLSGRVITLAGVKPEGSSISGGRSTFWLYGLVEPLTGEHFFEQYDHLNSENFEQFIHQFAARYPDEVIVIQMDQASAHRAHEIDWPENIIPLFQPAYTPEVNPIERFWKHLKTPLQWETFKNLQISTSASEHRAVRNDHRCHSLGHWMGVHHQCCIKRILKLNWYKEDVKWGGGHGVFYLLPA